MDFNPDENRFRDSRHEEDEEDDSPEEFRPRRAATFTDIVNLTTWQSDSSPMVDAGAAKDVKSSASAAATAPTPTDPLQAPLKDGISDQEQQSDDDSDEEQPSTRAKTPTQPEQTPTIRFPIDVEINGRVALWLGDVTKLKCDAIVNSTNESMTSRTALAGKILEVAGTDLIAELPGVDPCKTGECRVTKGFNLPASWILHTVGPRYNEKYITAAENALHNCYRSCLETAVEQRLKTIGLTVVHSTRRGYPPELGAHIAIRTVRRFLERWGRSTNEKSVQRVVFTFDSRELFDIYRRVLPLYCPRNQQELEYSRFNLPADTGNEFGETVVQERTVRIGAFPSGGLASPSNSVNPMSAPSAVDRPPASNADRNALSGLMAMQGDRDGERRRKLASLTPEQIQQQQLYMNYLQLAHRTDLKEVEKLNIIYQSGVDSAGRPIVIFCAMRLPEENQQLLDKIFLYYIKMMDVIANNDYILIYAHTNMASKSKPDFSWLKKVYNIFDDKYGEHMHRLYVLHPTFWLKFVETFFSTFASSRIFSKLTYIDKVVELFDLFGRDQIRLPQEILQFDQSVNGSIDVQTRAASQSTDRL